MVICLGRLPVHEHQYLVEFQEGAEYLECAHSFDGLCGNIEQDSGHRMGHETLSRRGRQAISDLVGRLNQCYGR